MAFSGHSFDKNGQEGLCDKQMRACDEKELKEETSFKTKLLLKCYK